MSKPFNNESLQVHISSSPEDFEKFIEDTPFTAEMKNSIRAANNFTDAALKLFKSHAEVYYSTVPKHTAQPALQMIGAVMSTFFAKWLDLHEQIDMPQDYILNATTYMFNQVLQKEEFPFTITATPIETTQAA